MVLVQPPRRGPVRASASGEATVEKVRFQTPEGRFAGVGTCVTLPSGYTTIFVGSISKRQAIAQAVRAKAQHAWWRAYFQRSLPLTDEQCRAMLPSAMAALEAVEAEYPALRSHETCKNGPAQP